MMKRNVSKEVSETSNQFGICYVHDARGIIYSISCCPMMADQYWYSVNVHSPSPSSHDCSHFTSGDSDTGCDHWLRPRGSHTCHSVGVLSGTPKDFNYFEVNRIEMAVRTEHQRNRNQLTTGHSCAGVDRGLSACPHILLYIYSIYCIVSHIPYLPFESW